MKIIGTGPEFEGQDLSMSCDEFLALQNFDDAPQPGKPSQSAIDLAAEKAAERELRASPAYQNAEALKAYQAFVSTNSFKNTIYNLELVNPDFYRFALYDLDNDGIVEMLFSSRKEKATIMAGWSYNNTLDPSIQRFNAQGSILFNNETESFGMCGVNRNETDYVGYYQHYNGAYADGITWTFSNYLKSLLSNDVAANMYPKFFFTDRGIGATDRELVEGTSLYRSLPSEFCMYPEFDLTDEEFYSLIDNCVKIIGYGPEFDGQDLSMSYNEFMALQSVEDAPQPSTNG